jgi:predicted transcriptional regulator
MRTLVDIGDKQIRALDELAIREKKSRAALIRTAVDDFLQRHQVQARGNAFGLWGNRKIDGLAYQEQVRSEW